jgi:putative protein kinase ArgK-like GTPase of G3E family
MKANFNEVFNDLDTLNAKDKLRYYIQLLKHAEPRHLERPPVYDFSKLTPEEVDELIRKIYDAKQDQTI